MHRRVAPALRPRKQGQPLVASPPEQQHCELAQGSLTVTPASQMVCSASSGPFVGDAAVLRPLCDGGWCPEEHDVNGDIRL
jgi:hypothetical protein